MMKATKHLLCVPVSVRLFESVLQIASKEPAFWPSVRLCVWGEGIWISRDLSIWGTETGEQILENSPRIVSEGKACWLKKKLPFPDQLVVVQGDDSAGQN